MKIKTLEAIGFKSFVDRLHLTFPEGITTIVGPNGCGKSNVVDAVLWAIGERSAKHLRGKLMEDVIFGGSEGRKPLGMAEVNLTFSNEDGTAPKAYADYSEITVTRRLYRSGESEYLINKVPCRLRDVTDLFLDTGIGINGYSIVEQGRVGHIINANPQDRRFLIEEAAGIAKYKERKRLALMKMEATQQNLVRIQDIIAEVKRQTVSLERQVKRAEEYKGIRKEMREIELRLALQEYAELSENAETAKGYLKALRERETDVAGQVAQKEALIEGIKLHGMEEEEKFRCLQQEVFDLARKIQRMEDEVEFFRRERGSLQKQETQIIGEVSGRLRNWREARRELRRLEQSRRELEEEYGENEEILKEWESLFSDFRTTHQELLDELESEKGQFIDTLTRLTSFKNRFIHLEERKEDLQKRLRSHTKESEDMKTGLGRLEEQFSRTEREKEQNLSFRAILQEEKERWGEEIERSKEALRLKQMERSALEETLIQNRSRFLSLRELQDNYEGFERGVKSILLKKKEEPKAWERIIGVVADLLEPEPKYEIPLEAVLGQRLQYLIVEKDQEALEAIALLKKESLGRGHFLPIGVRGTRNRDRSFETGGNEGPIPLIRFVHVKEGFTPLAEFLIGDVGVVESMNEALHGIKEPQGFGTLVTLDGDLVEGAGVISGGSLDQGLSILERRREIRDLERKIPEQEEQQKILSEGEEWLRKEITDKEIRLENAKKEIQEKEIELLHQKRDLEGLNKEIFQLHQQMEVLQAEGDELKREEREIETETESILTQTNREEALRKEREAQVQVLKKKMEEVGEGTEELGGKITEKKVLLASLEEKRRGIEGKRLNLSESIRTFRHQIDREVAGIRECRRERASLHEKIDRWENDLENCLENHRTKEVTLAAQKEKAETLSNEWREAEASTRYLRQELEEVRQKVHGEEIRASEFYLRVQHLQESIRERYGTNLSSYVPTGPELPKERMMAKLAESKTALEGFGEVNLMALEEYQELKRRHDFLTEQQADLQQALDALKKAIIRINRTTTKRFLDTFHRVNERFKEVFLRLFKGGQASLLLLDENDPATTGIDILAQPPGKKLQNIDLLSGGEKALVATALLFGLFMIKPTPFCLLDEVDAPLDDANINRFIDLIKDFSRTSQFIMITHNKRTMEISDTLYGITMETPGVSKIVSVRLN